MLKLFDIEVIVALCFRGIGPATFIILLDAALVTSAMDRMRILMFMAKSSIQDLYIVCISVQIPTILAFKLTSIISTANMLHCGTDIS